MTESLATKQDLRSSRRVRTRFVLIARPPGSGHLDTRFTGQEKRLDHAWREQEKASRSASANNPLTSTDGSQTRTTDHDPSGGIMSPESASLRSSSCSDRRSAGSRRFQGHRAVAQSRSLRYRTCGLRILTWAQLRRIGTDAEIVFPTCSMFVGTRSRKSSCDAMRFVRPVAW
jgi:hypothetical protein